MKKLNMMFVVACILNSPFHNATKENSHEKTQYILKNIMNDSWKDLDLKTKVFYEELLDSENIFNQAIILLQDYLVFQALITRFKNDNDEEYGIIYQEIKKQIKHFLKINETKLRSFSIKSIPINETNKGLIEALNNPNINIDAFCEILKIIFNTFDPDDLKNVFKRFASEDIKFEIIEHLFRIKNAKYPTILKYTGNYRYDLIIDIKDSSIRKNEEKSYKKNNEKYQELISTFEHFILTNKQATDYRLFTGRQEMDKQEQKARETSLTEESRFFNAATERFEKEKENEPRDNYIKNESLKIYIQQTLPTTDLISEDIKYSTHFYEINEHYDKHKQNNLMKDCAF